MEAFAFILFAAFVLGTIYLLMSQSRRARETYGFGLVVNWSFVLLVMALGCLLIGSLMTADDPANATVLLIAGAGLFGFSGFINVKRSTMKFGIWFTFLQLIAAIGIVVPLILIFVHWRSKAGMPGWMQ